jgi:hypothetical protein
VLQKPQNWRLKAKRKVQFVVISFIIRMKARTSKQWIYIPLVDSANLSGYGDACILDVFLCIREFSRSLQMLNYGKYNSCIHQLLISFDIFIGNISGRPQSALEPAVETTATTQYTKLSHGLADRRYYMSGHKTGQRNQLKGHTRILTHLGRSVSSARF